MIRFEDMTEYTKWFVKDAMDLGKYDIRFVVVGSINKIFCVCGTPLAIEYIAERGAKHFIDEWNYVMNEKVEENMVLDVDNDMDFVAELRDMIFSSLGKYMNMEIVYVSTEY